MATTTFVFNGNTITCNAADAPALLAALCGTSAEAPKAPTKAPTKAPKKSTKKAPAKAPKVEKAPTLKLVPPAWYDEFKSPDTTVEVKRTQVNVKVARGHASEWHDKLRAAGFTWSKKGFWWASLDDSKRSAVAQRHASTDAATAGMSKDERREYWRNHNASRKAS